MSRYFIRATLALLALLWLASPMPAWAQADAARDKAAAQALFDDGRKLLAAGEVAAACQKFEASNRTNPLPGTLLNLANCHEKLELLATAWGEYREALALARADGREDRIAFAEERLALLAPRVPRIVIELAPELGSLTGLAVSRDGVLLSPASLGTPLPLDPGTRVVIEARAPGHVAFRVEVTAVESRVETVRVPPLELEPAPVTPLAPLAEPKPALIVPPSPAPPASDGARSAVRVAGWVSAAVGAATALAGMSAGIYALTEEDAAETLGCSDTTCPDSDALARSEHANAAATAANVLLPIGTAIFGAGLVMILVPVSSPAGPSGAAFSVSGRF